MVADTYSAILGLLEQGTGNNNNTWGTLLNTGVMDKVDLAVAGLSIHSNTSGTVDLSVGPPPAGPSGAIHAIQVFNGALVGNLTVQVPNLSKIWLVSNATSGAFTLKFKTPSGVASSSIPQGGWTLVYCDGNNNISIGISTTAQTVQWVGADGTVSAPGLSFAAETNSGIYRKASQTIGVAINGIEIFEINASGVNLVSGTLSIGGANYLPSGTIIDYVGITEPAGWYFPVGQTKSRTTDAALFAAIAPNSISGTALTCNTHGNTTIDNLNVDLRGLGLEGATIEVTGASLGNTIVSINSATSMTVSATITGSTTGAALRILPYGQGDGSTTFVLPDLRGRVAATRDNLGGAAANRITTNAGNHLNTGGGEELHQLLQAEMPNHLHGVFLNDPGHSHTVSALPNGSSFGSGSFFGNNVATLTTSTNFTGITVRDTAGGGGTANQTATTGSSGFHNNMQPFQITNKLIKR